MIEKNIKWDFLPAVVNFSPFCSNKKIPQGKDILVAQAGLKLFSMSIIINLVKEPAFYRSRKYLSVLTYAVSRSVIVFNNNQTYLPEPEFFLSLL